MSNECGVGGMCSVSLCLYSALSICITLLSPLQPKCQDIAHFLLQDKTVPIPEKLNEWAPRPPPEFVRDVMGKLLFLVVFWANV